MASPVILTFGNPLLDMSVSLPNDDLLVKYHLKPADAILADEKGAHKALYHDLSSHSNVEYIAGGSGQNSTRVAQWMLQTPKSCAYVGSIGKDDNGSKLKAACEKEGVLTHYQVCDDQETGVCGVLIVNKDRSMVTDLKAANHYKIAHYHQADTQALVKSAKIVYIAGYFLTVSPETANAVAEYCNSNGKTFMMNLAANFLIEVPPFFERVEKLIYYSDFVFGNEHEAAAYGKVKGWGSDLTEIATRLQKEPKNGGKTNRVVVFTHSDKPCIVIGADGKAITTAAPSRLTADQIVDLNGAGDAFCGGFLAAFAKGKAIPECVAAAHWAASKIIQVSGTKLPSQCDYKF